MSNGTAPKKVSCIILCFVILLSLFGCGKGIVEDGTSTAQIITEKSEAFENTENTNENITESTNDDSAFKDSTTSKEKSQQSNTSNTEAKKESSTKNQSTTQIKTTQKAKDTTSKKTTQKITTSSSITCYVTVECKSILNNMDKLKENHQNLVPSGGYFINGYSVILKQGDTVYDAVKAACDSTGVSINAVSSSFGKYVAGFGGIDEKDCGSQSGWLYNVNGAYPSKSVSKYKLSDGDKIVFTYQCK